MSQFTLEQYSNVELYHLVKELIELMRATEHDLVLSLTDNIKASRRARVALVEISKQGKLFRALSIKHQKELKNGMDSDK